MNEKLFPRLFPALSLLLIVGMTGCAGVKNSMRLSEKNSAWNPLHRLSAEKQEAQKEDSSPVTMAAIWSDSVMEKSGRKDIKGFGGRFYFYDENNTAVKAEGELIVYGFDDSIKDRNEEKPDVKFVYKEDEFQSHYSESGLGASYSVWLPWEEVGGFRKSITLIPMFKTVDGKLLKSGQSINVLPGKTPEVQLTATAKRPYTVLGSSPAVIGQASYQSGTELPQSSNASVFNATYETDTMSHIKPTTIRMTPSMAQRMAMARSTVRDLKAKEALKATDVDQEKVNRIFVKKTGDDETSTDENAADAAAAAGKSQRAFGQPGAF